MNTALWLRAHRAGWLFAWTVPTLVVSAGLGTGAVTAQADSSYDELIAGGVREFNLDHWEEARALFSRAHTQKPSARTLRALGMTEFELRHYVRAHQLLSEALTDQRAPLAPELRANVDSTLASIRNFVDEYELSITPESAVVYVDGEPAVHEATRKWLLALGEHRLTISAPGHRSFVKRVEVRGGELVRLVVRLQSSELAPRVAAAARERRVSQPAAPQGVQLEPEPRSRGVGPWPTVLMIGGGGLVVGGAVLFGLGRADVNRVEHAADGSTLQRLQAPYERAPLLTGLGLGAAALGIASAAVGLTWWLRARSGSEPRPALRVTLQSIAFSGAF
jgi:hypothetical protein